MCSGEATRALPRVGFPIRRSRDQWLVSTFPGLIAAAHVLHRLSTPRHPPCALSLLIRKEHLCFRYGVFKVRAGCACFAGLSKLNSVELRGRRSSRRARTLDGLRPLCSTICGTGPPMTINRPNAYRSNGSGIPRKEVIQPQLPLRLPCYDFTPIIDPTFDGSLPCGLGHRLRVLPTFVV
jgi:hypothetical protein